MNAGTVTLTADQLQALRTRHPFEPDQSWVAEVVRTMGWRVANARYLEGERDRYAEAMRDLLSTLGIERPRDPQEALDLIELAFEVFAPETGFAGVLRRRGDCELYMRNGHCPTYELMESQGRLGVTACASWHRRRGWLDALHVEASDTMLSDKLWGSRACSTLLRIHAVNPSADVQRTPARPVAAA